MSGPLTIAVPSKGRLQDNANRFFARAGLDVLQGRGTRDYRGSLAGFDDVDVVFLPVAEIVGQLGDGQVHMGVAGEDLLREQVADADARVTLLTPLGFGHANVVVAVPQAWIDVRTAADLEDVAAIYHARHGRRMRVATKYIHLTRAFFAAKGVTDYRIVESLGATEGAPASGSAELIVDITTTGATLAANALKVLDDGIILRSEANLMASLKATWPEEHRATARRLLARIAAEETARTTRQVEARFAALNDHVVDDAARQFEAVSEPPEAGGAYRLRCRTERVGALADWLIEQGATQVSVSAHDYVFRSDNALYDRLRERLPRI